MDRWLLFLVAVGVLAGGCGRGSTGRGPDQIAVLGQPWGDSSPALAIRVPCRANQYALGSGPFVLADYQVYNLSTGKKLATLEGDWSESDVRGRAISADGQFCALVK